MTDLAGGMRSVIVEQFFPHSPEKVWRALTEQALLAQWLLKSNFAPSVGETFEFRADPILQWNGVIECKVLTVEPQRQLSYTWNSVGLESVVVFTLIPEEGSTRLRMEQSGFRPDQEAAFKGAGYGWQRFFSNLAVVLEGVNAQ